MATRPGRIAAELPVALPQPRQRGLRATAAYTAMCAEVSAHLAAAMGAG
jgi:hypothetical protein